MEQRIAEGLLVHGRGAARLEDMVPDRGAVLEAAGAAGRPGCLAGLRERQYIAVRSVLPSPAHAPDPDAWPEDMVPEPLALASKLLERPGGLIRGGNIETLDRWATVAGVRSLAYGASMAFTHLHSHPRRGHPDEGPHQDGQGEGDVRRLAERIQTPGSDLNRLVTAAGAK